MRRKFNLFPFFLECSKKFSLLPQTTKLWNQIMSRVCGMHCAFLSLRLGGWIGLKHNVIQVKNWNGDAHYIACAHCTLKAHVKLS